MLLPRSGLYSASQTQQSATRMGPTSPRKICCVQLRRPQQLLRPLHHSRHYSSAQSTKPNVRLNALLAVSLLAAAAGAYYYETQSGSSITPISKSKSLQRNAKTPEFSVHIRQRDGVKEYKFIRRSDEEVEKTLVEHQKTHNYTRIGNPVKRVDTNWVGSNEPCEDRSAIDLVPRNTKPQASLWNWLGASSTSTPSPSLSEKPIAVDRLQPIQARGDRDLMFFSVLDGHAGSATSELLSKVLHPTLTIALAGLEAGYIPNQGWGEKIAGYLKPFSTIGYHPELVARTLQHA